MQPSTFSWSNLVKTKSGLGITKGWPTITPPIQKQILNKKITLVNTTVVQIPGDIGTSKINIGEQPSSVDTLVDGIAKVSVNDNVKSREEIVAERKQRKLAAKKERQNKSLEQKLKEVRSLKSQKIQIIDNKFLENYQKCNNSIFRKSPEMVDKDISIPKTTTKNRIKQRLKNKNIISISLVELIENNRIQKIHGKAYSLEKKKSVIYSTIKRHRGKQREIQKVKQLKSLKRNILAIRQLRRELRVGENSNTDIVYKSQLSCIPMKFSRKFRPYCDHYTTPEINIVVQSLLQDLFRFQKRAYEKNQIKGSSKRRYIVGFNEVRRHLELNKVKLLIIAPDLEPNEGSGGLDESVESFKSISQTNECPYVFAISRWRIGRILFKKVSVSCVAVLNYDGADEHYKTILHLVSIERNRFIKDANLIIKT